MYSVQRTVYIIQFISSTFIVDTMCIVHMCINRLDDLQSYAFKGLQFTLFTMTRRTAIVRRLYDRCLCTSRSVSRVRSLYVRCAYVFKKSKLPVCIYICVMCSSEHIYILVIIHLYQSMK